MKKYSDIDYINYSFGLKSGKVKVYGYYSNGSQETLKSIKYGTKSKNSEQAISEAKEFIRLTR
tara:strand:- start:182 stop:370 length:189 start_codon:yes stop_codon:yes gene_type:complete